MRLDELGRTLRDTDPAAVLVQLLASFGNAAGRQPHFHVEGVRHHANLFAVIVGNSAKGRKGTSWGRARQIMEAALPLDVPIVVDLKAGLDWSHT